MGRLPLARSVDIGAVGDGSSFPRSADRTIGARVDEARWTDERMPPVMIDPDGAYCWTGRTCGALPDSRDLSDTTTALSSRYPPQLASTVPSGVPTGAVAGQAGPRAAQVSESARPRPT
jgi:hypothetical protein